MNVLLARLGGMARTRLMSAACSGWRRAAKLNREWIAASRALRLRMVLPRSRSMWSEQRADHWRVQVGEVRPAWHGAGARRREVKEQPDGVAVGGDRVRAGPPLADQPLGEERLHGAGDPRQRGAPPRRACGRLRRAAPERRSGTICAPAMRGPGRPIAAASGRRCHRRRSTSPARWRPRTNLHAAGSCLVGWAGVPAGLAWRLADVVVEQPGSGAGYQQRRAGRPGNRRSRSCR